MNTIHILVIFFAFAAVFAQFQPCTDLVNGVNPDTNTLTDPIFVNGQDYGYFSYNYTDFFGTEHSSAKGVEGFAWEWSSTKYSSGNGGRTPTLIGDDSYALFWNLPVMAFNGWQWNNNYITAANYIRTCGDDNETFTDGPGTMTSNSKFWSDDLPPLYNLTAWQKVYVPSSRTANWARVIHFVSNPGDITLHMNYMPSYYTEPDLLYINPGSNERLGIYSDLDQGRAFSVMPTTFNWMSKNARVSVRSAHAMDDAAGGVNANFELAPGATAAFMMIYSQNMNISMATETAQWIDTNPIDLYAKLSNEEISQIMNWDACAVVFDSKVVVTVTQADKCATSATIDISTTGTSMEIDMTHRVLSAAGEVVASNVTASVTLNSAGNYILETWGFGCVVKRTPFTAVINDATWDSETGEFNGSNGPFKFVAGTASALSITDKHGCTITGTFAAVTAPSTSSVPVSTPSNNLQKSAGSTVAYGLALPIASVAWLL